MTTLQIILTIPFAAALMYTILNLIEMLKFMLNKGQVSDDVRRRLRKRFKIGRLVMIVYFLFALFAFFINYLLTGGM